MKYLIGCVAPNAPLPHGRGSEVGERIPNWSALSR